MKVNLSKRKFTEFEFVLESVHSFNLILVDVLKQKFLLEPEDRVREL